MNILFRVDASSFIGAGHFMRCFNLAKALKPISKKIIFISRCMPADFQEDLSKENFEFIFMDEIEALEKPKDKKVKLSHSSWLEVSQEFDADLVIKKMGSAWDWVIVDHYSLDREWENKVRSITKKIFVIDDLADREHSCDILLDQNISPHMNSRYLNKVPCYCKLLLGPKFVLLNDEFDRFEKFKEKRNSKIRHVLIYFGSGDKQNYTAMTMSELNKVQLDNKIIVDVVVVQSHLFIEEIKSLCSKYKYNLHIQTKSMVELLSKCDLAIGSGGISTYERLFFGIPSLLIPSAMNQIEPLQYMRKMGFVNLFTSQDDFRVKVSRLLLNKISLPKKCVENGSKKIAILMLNLFASLRQLNGLGIRKTFYWIQDSKLRNDFFITDAPCRKNHFLYWRAQLSDKTQKIFSIHHFREHVGNCGIKNFNKDELSCELWIYIADLKSRNRGLSQNIINKLIETAKNDLFVNKIYLHVSLDNKVAINLYQKCGFLITNKKLEGRWTNQDNHVIHMEQFL